jgi:FtsZ-binding cell division protein ZapB
MNLDHNVLGMNYNEIIPLLTAGIKELKEENDTLKSQLSSLETRIQTLESA